MRSGPRLLSLLSIVAAASLLITIPFVRQQETIRLVNGTADEYCQIAEAREYFDEPALAFQAYGTAISIDPKSARAYLGRAKLWRSVHHSPIRAFLDVTRAVELNPDLADALLLRAELELEHADANEAVQDLDRVIQLDPDSQAAFLLRAQAHVRNDRLEDALSDSTRFLELHPAPDAARFGMLRLRASLYDKLNRQREAVSDLREAKGMNNGDVSVLNLLAWILATTSDTNLRDPATAIQLASDAASLSNNAPDVLDTLAAALAADDRFSDAIRIQEQALAVAPADQHDAFQARLNLYRKGQTFVKTPDNSRGE